jgi:hypothetical protein
MRAGIDLLGDKLKEAMVATHLKISQALRHNGVVVDLERLRAL